MADVKLWAYIDVCNEGDVDAMWLTEADHLAALERVLVETLREVAEEVDKITVGDVLDAVDAQPPEMDQVVPWKGIRVASQALVMAGDAIDRLINAATTGDTDD